MESKSDETSKNPSFPEMAGEYEIKYRISFH